MSQIKVWKIVKERKLKNKAVRLQDDRRREDRDSKIGKRVEKNNERSLARWEAIYGDSGRPEDSTAATSENSDPKKSSSVAEREIESIEMDDMSTATGDQTSKHVRNSVLEIVPEQPTPRPELRQFNFDDGGNDYGWWAADHRSTNTKSNAPSVDQTSLAEMLPFPSVPPLPQTSTPQTPGSEQSDGAEKPVHERRGVPLDKLGLQKLNELTPVALPKIEDDRASSVAATLDDEPDMDPKRLSVAPSLFGPEGNKGNLSPFSDEFKLGGETHSGARTPRTPGESPLLEEDEEQLVRSPTADAEAGAQETKRRSDAKGLGINEEVEESESEKAPSVHSLREERLPESISKIAMAYRTNEWAKHIADANQPDIEEEPQTEVEEPSVQVEFQRPAKEQPRAADPQALLSTGAPTQKSPKPESNPFRQTNKDGKVRRTSSSATPVYAFQRTNSEQSFQRQSSSNSLQRQSSSTSIQQQPKLERKPSQPLSNQILVESPIEEAESSHYETPLGSTLNLLDTRNSRLEKRMTTTSFNALNVPISTTPLSETGTGGSDIPLSQRKDLIDQGIITPMSPPKPRARHSNAAPPIARSASQNLIYDSHQPRRSNTVDTRKQSAMLTQWRQSLQQESAGAAPPPALLEEHARMQMIMQQRQVEHAARKREREREGREQQRDVAMRTSMLAGAHQDALRRMQAKADLGTGKKG